MDQAELFSHPIVFFVKKPEIETLFTIADQSVSMPPKSTWIEPKPCSHMVIRLMNWRTFADFFDSFSLSNIFNWDDFLNVSKEAAEKSSFQVFSSKIREI